MQVIFEFYEQRWPMGSSTSSVVQYIISNKRSFFYHDNNNNNNNNNDNNHHHHHHHHHHLNRSFLVNYCPCPFSLFHWWNDPNRMIASEVILVNHSGTKPQQTTIKLVLVTLQSPFNGMFHQFTIGMEQIMKLKYLSQRSVQNPQRRVHVISFIHSLCDNQITTRTSKVCDSTWTKLTVLLDCTSGKALHWLITHRARFTKNVYLYSYM